MEKYISLSLEFLEIGGGTLSVPLLMVWSVETNLINRMSLATWRVSGHPRGQQLDYSYICALIVIYPQLKVSYLSSFLDALLHVHNQSGFCLSVTASIQLYGKGGGRSEEKALSNGAVFPNSTWLLNCDQGQCGKP